MKLLEESNAKFKNIAISPDHRNRELIEKINSLANLLLTSDNIPDNSGNISPVHNISTQIAQRGENDETPKENDCPITIRTKVDPITGIEV